MFRNGTFRSLFLSYALLLVSVVILQAATASRNDLNMVRSEEREANRQAVEEISQMIDNNLVSIERFANSLNNTPWVHKLYFDLESLSEYYTPQRRREITREFTLYRSDDALTQRMFLLFPYRDIMIGSNQWSNIRDGLGIIGIPEQKRQAVLEEMMSGHSLTRLTRMEGALSNSKKIAFSIPLEVLSKPRAYLCSFIDSTRMAANIRTLMPGNMVAFRICQEGEVLLSVGQSQDDSDVSVQTASSGMIDWTFEFEFISDLNRFGYYEMLNEQLVLSAVIVLIGLVAAWFLSLFTYRPLRRLLDKLRAQRTAESPAQTDDYLEIGAIYDQITSERDVSMRSHVLRHLLQGYFELDEANEQMLRYGIPFNNVDYFQVYLIEKERSTAGHIVGMSDVGEMIPVLRKALAAMDNLRYELSDTADGKVALIMASSGRDVQQTDEMVRACLEQNQQTNGYVVFSGEISHGIIGISLSYQYALDKYVYLYRRVAAAKYYFPSEWETQLVSGLHAGSFQVAERILNETRRENQRRMDAGTISVTDHLTILSSLAVTLYRTAQELGLDIQASMRAMDGMTSLDEGWAAVISTCEQICREMETLNKPARDPVVEYVEKNFSDPDLSMDLLSEKFQMSAPTIIKRFKQSTNETFYACLLRLRVEKAKEMLAAGGCTSAEIAKATGYENEASFQRAFKRCVGTTPREYATARAWMKDSEQTEE